MERRSDGSIITKRDRIRYLRLQREVLNYPENTEAHREETRLRIQNHLSKYGDEDDGRKLSSHSSDSSAVSVSMASNEETTGEVEQSKEERIREEQGMEGQAMTQQATGEEEEVYDTGEALPWWVVAPKAQRDPLLPASPLTDIQLYHVVHTRLTAKERRDMYPGEFDAKGIPLRGRANRGAPVVVRTPDGRESYALICRAYQLHGTEGTIKGLAAAASADRATVAANVVPGGLRRLLRTPGYPSAPNFPPARFSSRPTPPAQISREHPPLQNTQCDENRPPRYPWPSHGERSSPSYWRPRTERSSLAPIYPHEEHSPHPSLPLSNDDPYLAGLRPRRASPEAPRIKEDLSARHLKYATELNLVLERAMLALATSLETRYEDGGLGGDLRTKTELEYDGLLNRIVHVRRQWGQGAFLPLKREPEE